ncbi:MMS19 nucleotide excision repair protein like protein [Trachymyrmex septentrionalis]|uniref:MMS19 nucleotide excision repair protein n=1 Tax=Trachymyrmex septentrionalis TaxID=34720 RepID=A0A195F8E4_9HYME|nr:MMS19 nucleotide excision repair protein like protein [Trachymyrmex septentrionalis]
MALSLNFDLKEQLDVSFKDTTALSLLCRNIASEDIKCFILEIESGSIKLYTFVEILGSYMTDQNVLTREKGVTTLSSVLSQLPQDYLTESELYFITTFYCDRMKDHYSIIPSVLSGIQAIVNMIHLPQNASSSLLRVMFEHVQCQSQLLSERHKIYLIFKSLIENRLNDLKPMGPDLVYGISSSMDGERDPNNLMLLFNMLPHFIKNFPLGHLTEEMFEVMACYFPVDFNPSGIENLNVTREDLAEKLAPCLCAIPEFADYCLPLIIDKSYSTLRVAKLDSLNLLRESVQIFGLSKIESYLPDLWTTLKKEVIPGRDVEIRDTALQAITSLIKVISVDETVCKNFIDKIIVDVKSSLCDVQLSLYRPAQTLLETIAAINKTICVQILQIIIPLCIGQYSTKNSFNDKIALIETLNNLMKICSNYDFCFQDVPELSWTNIPQTYLDGLTVENIELKSKIFFGLTIQKAHLNGVQRSILYDAICNEIGTGCDKIQIICHTTIIDFATLYLEEIIMLVKERLLSNIDEMEVELLKRRIKALSAIAKIHELGCIILPKIVTILMDTVNTDICITILLNIQKLIALKKSDYNIHQFLYKECHIIDKLILYETNIVDHKMLISNICQLIVRNLTIEEQRAIVMKYAVALDTKVPETDVTVIMNLFIPLRKDIDLNLNNDMVENLYNLATSNCNLDIRQTSCKFLSVLLNKIKVSDLDRIVSYLENKINNNLSADNDIKLKQHTVNFQIWMTKALVMRGYAKSQYFLENLTLLLTHDEIGQFVGEQYQILVNKYEDILITENFCDVKIFYKQRVFEYLLRQNINFTSTMRQNYLIALVHLLEQMPEELLFLHLTELVPLLIESLSLSNEYLVLWTLMSFKLLLDTKHDVFSDNVQCVIPRLMQLSTHRIMGVRIAVLECLAHYANYPTILINPYKQIVLDKLGVIIDDRKRLVRKAAVNTRIRWYLVGASGEQSKE